MLRADTGKVREVHGAVGLLTAQDGQPIAVLGLTIVDGRIVAMDIPADPQRLTRLDLTVLD